MKSRDFVLVPENVSDIKSTKITSRNISLSWKPPCHPNGIINNYRIRVYNLSDSSLSKTIDTKTNNTSIDVNGLLPYRTYQFSIATQVESVTDLGPDSQSEPIATKIEGKGFIVLLSGKCSSI